MTQVYFLNMYDFSWIKCELPKLRHIQENKLVCKWINLKSIHLLDLNLITLEIVKFDTKSQSFEIFRGHCQIKINSYQLNIKSQIMHLLCFNSGKSSTTTEVTPKHMYWLACKQLYVKKHWTHLNRQRKYTTLKHWFCHLWSKMLWLCTVGGKKGTFELFIAR